MNNLKKRILVVDDEQKITRQIRLNLELTGEFEVREETRASHALISVREFLPDLVLLDVMMPGVEGDELASEIRTLPKFREVPIVFLTALVTPEEIKKSGGYRGGERFLAKPVDPLELIECLHQELEKRSIHPVPGNSAKATEDASSHLAY